MAMGTRRKRRRQHGLWISAADLTTTAAHPFYRRVNAMLDAHRFDEFVEDACRAFYAETMGRPSLTLGMYFRLLLVGDFEGIDSERGIAWRAADSLAIRQFLHLALEEAAPDHSTISRTRRLIDAVAAAEQVEDAQASVTEPQPLEEIIADKGYHSNQTMVDLDAVDIRSYIAEPDRGRRDWSETPEAQAPVYRNRRRIRGRRGRRLMRQRGERIERSFAHLYDTGGMRRTHLRGHTNILKRLLIHAGGFNLGLVLRHRIGVGTRAGCRAASRPRWSSYARCGSSLTACGSLSARNQSTLDSNSRRVTVSNCCPSQVKNDSLATGC